MDLFYTATVITSDDIVDEEEKVPLVLPQVDDDDDDATSTLASGRTCTSSQRRARHQKRMVFCLIGAITISCMAILLVLTDFGTTITQRLQHHLPSAYGESVLVNHNEDKTLQSQWHRSIIEQQKKQPKTGTTPNKTATEGDDANGDDWDLDQFEQSAMDKVKNMLKTPESGSMNLYGPDSEGLEMIVILVVVFVVLIASGLFRRRAAAAAENSETGSVASNKMAPDNSGDNNNDEKQSLTSSSPTSNDGGITPFKLLLLGSLVLQFTSTVLVGHYIQSIRPPDQRHEVSHLIFVCEVCKFCLSCAFETYDSQGQLWGSLQLHVFQRPLDALKISVPALLYLVQNTLFYIALSNLSAPVLQATYQAKLVTTAIVSVLLLKRSYDVKQWICLVGISAGVALVVSGEYKPKKEEEEEPATPEEAGNTILGLACVATACMSSAFAGVYFEKILKKPDNNGENSEPNPSLWMRNIQLAFFSVLISITFQGGLSSKDGKSYLHGFNIWVWILVALQSGGGLLLAAVMKYADNVLKGLATGVSVVLSSALSMVIFGTALGAKFFSGGAVILTCVWFFSNPLPQCGRKSSSGEGDSAAAATTS